MAVTDGADQMSLTFRFDDATNTLRAASAHNLADLAQRMEAGLVKDKSLILCGFLDSQGDVNTNLTLSKGRAGAVMAAVKA